MWFCEFSKQYMKLFFAQQKKLWINYLKGYEDGLDSINARIYQLLVRGQKLMDQEKKRPESGVAEDVIRRGLVDHHPEVSGLRNRIDEAFFSPAGEDPSLSELKPLVIGLMKVRNEHARRQGFESYPDLVFRTESLDPGQVKDMVARYLDSHIEQAYGVISKYGLKQQNWFQRLREISRIRPVDPLDLYRCLLGRLGLSTEVLDGLQVHVGEDLLSGFVTAASVPDDVRLMIKPIHSLRQMTTACHELGHALHHLHNAEQGLLTTWSAIYDECMAVLLERLSLQTVLDDCDRRLAEKIAMVENVRQAISFSFEMDLWEHPEHADKLYRRHYSQIGWAEDSHDAWVLDTFRSLDPVYVHNYVIGAVVADRTADHLRRTLGCSPDIWGGWIRDNYYFDGRRRSLRQKTADVVSWSQYG